MGQPTPSPALNWMDSSRGLLRTFNLEADQRVAGQTGAWVALKPGAGVPVTWR